MKFFQIDVDEKVFEYLKKNAEPFVDTPNSVLRKELFQKGPEQVTSTISSKNEGGETNSDKKDFPVGTPVALQHTLEVIQLVRMTAYTRNEATNIVAKRHNVFPQTVQDKYCRQLSLSANDFDRLLGQTNLEDLTILLVNKFPSHKDFINSFLSKELK